MKKLIKQIVVNLLAFLITVNLIGGIDYHNSLGVLLIASLCLLLLNMTARPLLNLLFMPINMITLGASRWLINILIFYSITVFVDFFTVTSINIAPTTFFGFAVPVINLSFFWSLVLISLTVQLSISLLSLIFY